MYAESATSIGAMETDDVTTEPFGSARGGRHSLLSLRPLFPVEEIREAAVGRAPARDDHRQGHVWPVAALLGLDEQPMIAVEMAFYPVGGLPEPLADESWAKYCDDLGLAPFAGAASLRAAPDGSWHVDFGPHMQVANMARPYEVALPRPDAEWEEAVRANGSCVVVFGTGFGSNDETGAVGFPSTAAAVTAAYAGSRSVPELSEIPGLHVVPVNSLRPYAPMRPLTFVLDTNVLIAMEHFCFKPTSLGARSEAIRHLLVNLAGRGVLPGPALGQIYQPSRTTTNRRSALKALAAFELVMSLSRAEIMDEKREAATFDEAFERDLTGSAAFPQMLVMYAGVLRLRQLWHPSQTLAEWVESFEAFMHWLRYELRVNAGLLVQVAFNLWIADEPAKRQASRLLHFHAGTVNDETLRQLWGTAYDIFLIAGHADTMQIADVPDAVILTFDRGLAGMRDFFEHVDELGEAARAAGLDPDYVGNARVKMDFHPALDYMRPRVAKLAADLHRDMFARMAERGSAANPRADLVAIVQREERLLTGARD
jgi:hypothetical protein